MATTASFKQPCPSCDAKILIKDHGMIGRKIDCPRCKYRFLVETPAPVEEEDDAAQDNEPTPAPEAKGKTKKEDQQRVTTKPASPETKPAAKKLPAGKDKPASPE